MNSYGGLKIIVLLFLVIGQGLLAAGQAKASVNDIKVSPTAIDIVAHARDVLHYDIIVENTGDTLVNLYVVLKDWTSSTSQQLSLDELNNSDRVKSLSRWLKIKRGVIEMNPKTQTEISLDIEVNLNALPGIYHAVITLAEGTDRSNAETRAGKEMMPQVLLTVQVNPEIIEKAQLVSFKTDKNLFLQSTVNLMAEIKNIGTEDITPTGVIMIYDRRGQEVASFSVNDKQKPINPDISVNYSYDWSQAKGFGKYKAVLNLEYGNISKRDINDIIYFWILPMSYILVIASIILVTFILFLVLMIRIIKPKERSKNIDGVINLR